MPRVEGGRSALQRRIPRIEYLVAQAGLCRDPLGIRALVDRVGVSVVHIELHTVGHGMAQDELTRVIVAVADRSPCIEGSILRGIVLRRALRDAAQSDATWRTRVPAHTVNNLLERSLIVHVAARHEVKHVLGCGRCCWAADWQGAVL